MDVIQIEITNACPHLCANCTRFCGHHEKPFFMDFDTFKNALDSLDGFPGTVGIMGGEPTLNSDFDRIVRYYRSRIEEIAFPGYRVPRRDFKHYVERKISSGLPYRRAIWTSLGGGYYKNFELLQETFPIQYINDHTNSGLHQALLMPRKELGIPDDRWFELRDRCWIQNMWSASITPKGAFFCEVAAALDMLFDGPGGWPVEPGWWKRKPEDFKDQLHWCEYCSAPLPAPRIEANTHCDIITPGIERQLAERRSPKLKKQMFTIFDPAQYTEEKFRGNADEVDWYLPAGKGKLRVSKCNESLYPRLLNLYFPGRDETSRLEVEKNWRQAGCRGRVLTPEEFARLDFNDWLLIISDPNLGSEEFFRNAATTIFNPGIRYTYRRDKGFQLINRMASTLRGVKTLQLTDLDRLYLAAATVPVFAWPDFTRPGLRRSLMILAENWPRLKLTIPRRLKKLLSGRLR